MSAHVVHDGHSVSIGGGNKQTYTDVTEAMRIEPQVPKNPAFANFEAGVRASAESNSTGNGTGSRIDQNATTYSANQPQNNNMLTRNQKSSDASSSTGGPKADTPILGMSFGHNIADSLH